MAKTAQYLYYFIPQIPKFQCKLHPSQPLQPTKLSYQLIPRPKNLQPRSTQNQPPTEPREPKFIGQLDRNLIPTKLTNPRTPAPQGEKASDRITTQTRRTNVLDAPTIRQQELQQELLPTQKCRRPQDFKFEPHTNRSLPGNFGFDRI